MAPLLYVLSLVLSLTVQVGLSPLKTSARVTLDPQFLAGTVCLIWESEDEHATPGSDCWTVEPVYETLPDGTQRPRAKQQRTWIKDLTLRTGVYGVWVTEVGQDTQGRVFKARSPERRVEVN